MTVWNPPQIELLKASDAQTWRCFVDQFAPSLFRFFRNTLREEEEANELVAETLRAVLSSLQRFQGQASLETWLFQIARHKLYDRHRGQSRFQDFLQRYTPFQDVSREASIDPETLLLCKSELEWMERAMQTLPLKYREALTLRFIEELSIKEVAQILGVSTDVVKNLTRDGKSRLRKHLEKWKRRSHTARQLVL